MGFTVLFRSSFQKCTTKIYLGIFIVKSPVVFLACFDKIIVNDPWISVSVEVKSIVVDVDFLL